MQRQTSTAAITRLNSAYRRALARLAKAEPGTAGERRALAAVIDAEERAAAWSAEKGRAEKRGLVLGCRPGYIAVWVEIGLFLLACACLLVLAGSARGSDFAPGGILLPGMQCKVNRAEDAGCRAGIDLQWAAGRVAK